MAFWSRFTRRSSAGVMSNLTAMKGKESSACTYTVTAAPTDRHTQMHTHGQYHNTNMRPAPIPCIPACLEAPPSLGAVSLSSQHNAATTHGSCSLLRALYQGSRAASPETLKSRLPSRLGLIRFREHLSSMVVCRHQIHANGAICGSTYKQHGKLSRASYLGKGRLF